MDFVKTTKTPVATEVSEELLAPLPPALDQNILTQLEQRANYE